MNDCTTNSSLCIQFRLVFNYGLSSFSRKAIKWTQGKHEAKSVDCTARRNRPCTSNQEKSPFLSRGMLWNGRMYIRTLNAS